MCSVLLELTHSVSVLNTVPPPMQMLVSFLSFDMILFRLSELYIVFFITQRNKDYTPSFIPYIILKKNHKNDDGTLPDRMLKILYDTKSYSCKGWQQPNKGTRLVLRNRTEHKNRAHSKQGKDYTGR